MMRGVVCFNGSKAILRFTIVFICAVLLFGNVAQAQTKKLSLEMYFDWETVSDPQISPDGKQIVYTRGWVDKVNDRTRSSLWIMNADGSRSRFLVEGSSPRWSPDGTRIAYTPYVEAFWSWKRYRGGMTVPIWVLDLASLEHFEIPHQNASDTFPCWLGKDIFFLSDRKGVMNVFRCNLSRRSVKQVTFHKDFDVRSLTAGAGFFAYSAPATAPAIVNVISPDAVETQARQ